VYTGGTPWHGTCGGSARDQPGMPDEIEIDGGEAAALIGD